MQEISLRVVSAALIFFELFAESSYIMHEEAQGEPYKRYVKIPEPRGL